MKYFKIVTFLYIKRKQTKQKKISRWVYRLRFNKNKTKKIHKNLWIARVYWNKNPRRESIQGRLGKSPAVIFLVESFRELLLRCWLPSWLLLGISSCMATVARESCWLAWMLARDLDLLRCTFEPDWCDVIIKSWGRKVKIWKEFKNMCLYHWKNMKF